MPQQPAYGNSQGQYFPNQQYDYGEPQNGMPYEYYGQHQAAQQQFYYGDYEEYDEGNANLEEDDYDQMEELEREMQGQSGPVSAAAPAQRNFPAPSRSGPVIPAGAM